MTAEIVKFPFNVSRRAHARRPRRSKNGTPEERAAKAPAAAVTDISRPSVIAAAAKAEEMDPWYQIGLLLRKLDDRNLLTAGVDCWRLLLERHGAS
jgi:hypothetical protein